MSTAFGNMHERQPRCPFDVFASWILNNNRYIRVKHSTLSPWAKAICVLSQYHFIRRIFGATAGRSLPLLHCTRSVYSFDTPPVYNQISNIATAMQRQSQPLCPSQTLKTEQIFLDSWSSNDWCWISGTWEIGIACLCSLVSWKYSVQAVPRALILTTQDSLPVCLQLPTLRVDSTIY